MARFAQTRAYQPAPDFPDRRPAPEEQEDFSDLLEGTDNPPVRHWQPAQEVPLMDERDFDLSQEREGGWYDEPAEEYIENDDDDYFPDELLTEEDHAELRRERWHTLARLWDFLGVIAGTVAVLVLIALLISLLNWLQADVVQTFSLLQTNL
ncbi:MAG: hypothetical protein E7333_04070 [Clostridiales bacterium]|nr:hypothetical protein [Clostridiales bacterium]